MTSVFGRHIRSRREAAGYNPQTLAQAIGYRNTNKGARRLQHLEDAGLETQEFVDRVLAVLDVDRGRAKALYLEDEAARRAAWEAWVDEPVRPMLFRNWGPLFTRAMGVLAAPSSCTTEQAAEAWARAYAREHHWRMRLMPSRREDVWIGADGEIEGRTTYSYDKRPVRPSISLRGRSGARFLFAAPAEEDRQADS